MEKTTVTYHMHKLAGYPELEAITAQEKAGSRSAYFKRLDDFAQAGPSLVEGLGIPHTDEEWTAFSQKILLLRELLRGIGALSLQEKAEKIAERAREKDAKQCGDVFFAFRGKVKDLRAKLLDVRSGPAIEEPTPEPVPDAPPEMDDASPSLGMESMRLPTPGEPKALETLCRLIDNSETDAAMEALRSLMGTAHSPKVDEVLAAMRITLIRGDHDRASTLGKRLLEAIKEKTPGAAPAERKRILVVDDMPNILDDVKAILKDAYSVYGVTTPMAALRFLANSSADLILLDIEMPEMDGFDLLAIIRKMKDHETTPVLFFTGNSTTENVRRSMTGGATDFIKKPVDAQALIARIQKYLASVPPAR